MMQGAKGELSDAGTRIPLIINCPGVTPEGRICDDLIDFSDFMPTLAELAGTRPPDRVPIDGRSFTPQIYGKTGNPREWVYNQYEGKAWVRSKNWKLYSDGRLYNMREDTRESHPILEADDSEDSGRIRKKLKNFVHELDTGLAWK
jgi:arylsulfatase A